MPALAGRVTQDGSTIVSRDANIKDEVKDAKEEVSVAYRDKNEAQEKLKDIERKSAGNDTDSEKDAAALVFRAIGDAASLLVSFGEPDLYAVPEQKQKIRGETKYHKHETAQALFWGVSACANAGEAGRGHVARWQPSRLKSHISNTPTGRRADGNNTFR